MKIKCFLTTFIVFVVLMLCIGSISAVSEDIGDNIGSEMEDSISVSDEEAAISVDDDSALNAQDNLGTVDNASHTDDKLNNGNDESLSANEYHVSGKQLTDINDALYNNPEADTFYLDGHTYIANEYWLKPIEVTRSLTIYGGSGPSDTNMATLDGNGLVNILYISAYGKVTIKNVIFKNGTAKNGGAIFSNADLTIDNCRFISNNASENGGAVFINSKDSVVKDSQFNSNNATVNGGAIFWNAENGNVINSIFEENAADNVAGAIFWNGKYGKISGSNFNKNYGKIGAGAVHWNDDNGVIDNSKFIDNYGDYVGGAIIWEDKLNAKITNSYFSGNRVDEGSGGAVFFKPSKGLIIDCTFESNAVSWQGGAVYLDSAESSIIGSNLTNNSAYAGAGVFINGNNAVVEGSTFSNNKAVNGAGIASDGNGTLIKDTKFQNNVADRGAGAMLNGKDASLVNDTFTGNVAADGTNAVAASDDDAVSVDNATRENSDCTICLKNTEIIANLTAASIQYGEDLVILANVTSKSAAVNGGVAYIVINGKTYSANVVDGAAKITASGVSSGNYTGINVVYNGTDEYCKAFCSVDFNITKANPVLSSDIASTVFYLEPNKCGAYLKDANNKAISGAEVKFIIKGKEYRGTTDGNGYAYVSPNLAPGSYNVDVKFEGNDQYKEANASAKITVKHIISAKKTTNVKKSAKKTIINIGVKGEKIKATKNVKFTSTGKKKVKIKFGSVMAKQTVTVKFKGKTYNVKVNSKGVGTLKLSKKLKKGKYSAKVTYTQSKPFKNVKVTVKFNGKTYSVKTNKNGIAKFKVTKSMVKKLSKGKTYQYTATYKGDSLSRDVKITK